MGKIGALVLIDIGIMLTAHGVSHGGIWAYASGGFCLGLGLSVMWDHAEGG